MNWARALLERTNRRVRLSEAGEVFLIRATRILEQIDQAVREATRVGQGDFGSFSVGVVSTAVCSYLPEILRAFRRQSPNLNIDIHEMEPGEQVDALTKETINLGLLFLSIQDPAFDSVLVSRERLIVAMPTGHPAASRDKVRLSDLAEETFLIPRRQTVSGFHELVLNTLHSNGVTVASSPSRLAYSPPRCFLLPVIWESRWSQSRSGIIYAYAAASIAMSRVLRPRTNLVGVWREERCRTPLPYEGSFNCWAARVAGQCRRMKHSPELRILRRIEDDETSVLRAVSFHVQHLPERTRSRPGRISAVARQSARFGKLVSSRNPSRKEAAAVSPRTSAIRPHCVPAGYFEIQRRRHRRCPRRSPAGALHRQRRNPGGRMAEQ